MKNLRFLTAAIAILSITACSNGQIRKTVFGNHKVVTEERNAEYFNGIKTSSGIDVFLKQGNKESVSVEADGNLQEYIITEVKGGILHIYTEANIRDAESKKVFVTMKDVNSVQTTSAGDVIGETPIKSDRLELSASSAGSIKLEVHANNIEVHISSSGDITLTGDAGMLEADLSSAGDLNAYNLEVKEADVSASSAGDADINVSEKLTARASSAGDIHYMGDPKYVDAHSSSAGGIHKK
ncbi:MAG: DUF2807 domain-containing protein [Bacteroidales bacterium]|nr:DUF2807 domain-containing protein [Bacteroidales bacterium]